MFKLKVDLHLSDLSALVVTSEDGNAVLEAHLEGDKKSDGLDWVVATVNVVTHEEVVRVGGLTSNLKKFTQVVELTMDITADCHWCTHLLHIRLIN